MQTLGAAAAALADAAPAGGPSPASGGASRHIADLRGAFATLRAEAMCSGRRSGRRRTCPHNIGVSWESPQGDLGPPRGELVALGARCLPQRERQTTDLGEPWLPWTLPPNASPVEAARHPHLLRQSLEYDPRLTPPSRRSSSPPSTKRSLPRAPLAPPSSPRSRRPTSRASGGRRVDRWSGPKFGGPGVSWLGLCPWGGFEPPG